MTQIRPLPFFLALAAVCVALGLTQYFTRDTRPDIEKIQGAWEFDISRYDKPTIPPDDADQPTLPLRYVFRGDKLTMELEGKVVGAYTFAIDPTKSPPTIDMSFAATETMSLVERGIMFLASQHPVQGIYQLSGNELVICQAADGGLRPTDFSPKQGHLHFVLRRVK
jgi:uncharacterized protein (TIGR03067 family)